jgi:hypothetical protein
MEKDPVELCGFIAYFNPVFRLLDNVLQTGQGVGKVMDWSFRQCDTKTKKRLYAAFWREVVRRAEVEDLSGQHHYLICFVHG